MKTTKINVSRGNLNEYTDRQGADKSPSCPICGENLYGPVAYYIDDCITPFCGAGCANAAARDAAAFAKSAEASF